MMTKNKQYPMIRIPAKTIAGKSLVQDVRTLIEQAREYVAKSVNTSLIALYWQIGRRISKEVLRGRRAEYGEQILSTL